MLPKGKGIGNKELLLVYAVIGFGSVALVALGELGAAEPGHALFRFYLNLVFGGLVVFYGVFFHFAFLNLARKIDARKGVNPALKALFGEKASFGVALGITLLVLMFWVLNFVWLMRDTGVRFGG